MTQIEPLHTDCTVRYFCYDAEDGIYFVETKWCVHKQNINNLSYNIDRGDHYTLVVLIRSFFVQQVYEWDFSSLSPHSVSAKLHE